MFVPSGYCYPAGHSAVYSAMAQHLLLAIFVPGNLRIWRDTSRHADSDRKLCVERESVLPSGRVLVQRCKDIYTKKRLERSFRTRACSWSCTDTESKHCEDAARVGECQLVEHECISARRKRHWHPNHVPTVRLLGSHATPGDFLYNPTPCQMSHFYPCIFRFKTVFRLFTEAHEA